MGSEVSSIVLFFPPIAIPSLLFLTGTYYFSPESTMTSFKVSGKTIRSHMMYSWPMNEQNILDKGYNIKWH